MLKQIALLAGTVLVLSAVIMPTSYLRAGNEWNDDCYNAGFSDGQDEPFSHANYVLCGDEPGGADAYYDGFIDGCMAVEGNTRNICES